MSIAERAKEVYELELRSRLETTHYGQFVAIEPVSKAFFSGNNVYRGSIGCEKCVPGQKVLCVENRA